MATKQPVTSPKLKLAFDFACDCHDRQVRKSTSIPYISHLMSVSALVFEYGGDEEQAIAGLLHDAVEDADTAVEAARRMDFIQQNFGERVLRIVMGCTDGTPNDSGKKADWKERKTEYLKHLAEADADTLLVSCSDKVHNARAIVSDLRLVGGDVFSRFKAGKEGTLWYYKELSATFNRVFPGPIAQSLELTVSEMVKITG